MRLNVLALCSKSVVDDAANDLKVRLSMCLEGRLAFVLDHTNRHLQKHHY